MVLSIDRSNGIVTVTITSAFYKIMVVVVLYELNGKLVTGPQTIDGLTYYFDSIRQVRTVRSMVIYFDRTL